MFPELMVLLRAHYDESPAMQRLPFSEERIEAMLAAVIHPAMSKVIYGAAAIDWDSRLPEGLIIASTGSVWYSDEPIVNDVVIYVRPESRSHGIAKLMLAAYEKWAKRMGITKLFFTQSTGIEPERTEKAFEAMGWQWLGSYMMKDAAEKK